MIREQLRFFYQVNKFNVYIVKDFEDWKLNCLAEFDCLPIYEDQAVLFSWF